MPRRPSGSGQSERRVRTYHDEKTGDVHTPGELFMIVRRPSVILERDGYSVRNRSGA
jgi:hypothetical protein